MGFAWDPTGTENEKGEAISFFRFDCVNPIRGSTYAAIS
jgi:hypothetical protein